MCEFLDFCIYREDIPAVSTVFQWQGGVFFVDSKGGFGKLEKSEDCQLNPIILRNGVEWIFSSCVIDDSIAAGGSVFNVAGLTLYDLPCLSGDALYQWSKNDSFFFASVAKKEAGDITYIFDCSEGKFRSLGNVDRRIIFFDENFCLAYRDGELSFGRFEGEFEFYEQIDLPEFLFESLKGFSDGVCGVLQTGELFLWSKNDGVNIININELGFSGCKIKGVEVAYGNEIIISIFSYDVRKLSFLGRFDVDRREFVWLRDANKKSYSYRDILIDDELIYTTLDSSMVVLRLSDGLVLWESRFKNSFVSKIVRIEKKKVMGYSENVGLTGILVERACDSS